MKKLCIYIQRKLNRKVGRTYWAIILRIGPYKPNSADKIARNNIALSCCPPTIVSLSTTAPANMI